MDMARHYSISAAAAGAQAGARARLRGGVIRPQSAAYPEARHAAPARLQQKRPMLAARSVLVGCGGVRQVLVGGNGARLYVRARPLQARRPQDARHGARCSMLTPAYRYVPPAIRPSVHIHV